jgi:hypothetical protein
MLHQLTKSEDMCVGGLFISHCRAHWKVFSVASFNQGPNKHQLSGTYSGLVVRYICLPPIFHLLELEVIVSCL